MRNIEKAYIPFYFSERRIGLVEDSMEDKHEINSRMFKALSDVNRLNIIIENLRKEYKNVREN